MNKITIKQQVVDRLEGKQITILKENIIYFEEHKKVKFMFRGFEFEIDYWNKQDSETGDYESNQKIYYEGNDVEYINKFDDNFLDELNEVVEEELI